MADDFRHGILDIDASVLYRLLPPADRDDAKSGSEERRRDAAAHQAEADYSHWIKFHMLTPQ
jgi:hypothetical protein